jgi:hypothetical protein
VAASKRKRGRTNNLQTNHERLARENCQASSQAHYHLVSISKPPHWLAPKLSTKHIHTEEPTEESSSFGFGSSWSTRESCVLETGAAAPNENPVPPAAAMGAGAEPPNEKPAPPAAATEAPGMSEGAAEGVPSRPPKVMVGVGEEDVSDVRRFSFLACGQAVVSQWQ